MGYRSDVCICCERKAYEKIIDAVKRFELKAGYKFSPKEKVDNNGLYYLQWRWVKWYENFDEVITVENALKELPNDGGYRYVFARIGENDNDIEYKRNDDYEIEFYITREFDIPKDAGLVGEAYVVEIQPCVDTKCQCGKVFSKFKDGVYSIPSYRRTNYCPDCGVRLIWN